MCLDILCIMCPNNKFIFFSLARSSWFSFSKSKSPASTGHLDPDVPAALPEGLTSGYRLQPAQPLLTAPVCLMGYKSGP